MREDICRVTDSGRFCRELPVVSRRIGKEGIFPIQSREVLWKRQITV